MHIIREVAATIERPGLLFSGGKDSVVMLHLAVKAFWPAPVPLPVMHVDTSENFDEVIEFRDRTVERFGLRLVVAKVQDDIDAGRVTEDTGPNASRNRLQTVTLLRGIREKQFGAVFGGARRDEEKARAKEWVFSFRDEFGQWDPRNQRPELWSLYNGRHRKGENVRVFPAPGRFRPTGLRPRRGQPASRPKRRPHVQPGGSCRERAPRGRGRQVARRRGHGRDRLPGQPVPPV